eukprot:gb/GEZN01009596.1/.p1 GENE.gb/GEZN01009596.1/~~gb/GEZN01009596.1/.p1  ORF type:complete len:262 (+),score=16.27 gb/GEZN01009596.1/:37-822(+)
MASSAEVKTEESVSVFDKKTFLTLGAQAFASGRATLAPTCGLQLPPVYTQPPRVVRNLRMIPFTDPNVLSVKLPPQTLEALGATSGSIGYKLFRGVKCDPGDPFLTVLVDDNSESNGMPKNDSVPLCYGPVTLVWTRETHVGQPPVEQVMELFPGTRIVVDRAIRVEYASTAPTEAVLPMLSALALAFKRAEKKASKKIAEECNNVPGRISTSLYSPQCGHCGKRDKSLHKCARCKLIYYCNKDCQRMAWKDHKRVCKSTK